MKVKTATLTGPALDWAVAKAKATPGASFAEIADAIEAHN